ncbi:uncharacterized protein LOC125240797 [Leguminivora glycinivorella]|uniref:uncharacterized protein LOC125240797 n=1 Tax=Leguminivora glycinivorella TaxID=1035111 RepID=UPI00200FEE3D|nr:uncharacterized protein LOC125240797 [Leguminivora glycinivorella]
MINDLPSAISNCRCLIFADDLKLLQPVANVCDCRLLQESIDKVAEWSEINRLQLNVSKCKVISFSRSKTPVTYSYCLQSVSLERVRSIRDLGVIIDSGLTFQDHIVDMCKKANKNLGFIMRIASQFRDTRIALVLYNAFVRSRMEFNCIVWDPTDQKYRDMMEKIQKKFARYLYKRLYGRYPFLYPSLFVAGMVGLETLELRRKMLLAILFAVPATRTQYARRAPTSRA